MVRKSQGINKSKEKLRTMTKVNKSQVKKEVFEKSLEKKEKHQILSVQIYQIPYI